MFKKSYLLIILLLSIGVTGFADSVTLTPVAPFTGTAVSGGDSFSYDINYVSTGDNITGSVVVTVDYTSDLEVVTDSTTVSIAGSFVTNEQVVGLDQWQIGNTDFSGTLTLVAAGATEKVGTITFKVKDGVEPKNINITLVDPTTGQNVFPIQAATVTVVKLFNAADTALTVTEDDDFTAVVAGAFTDENGAAVNGTITGIETAPATGSAQVVGGVASYKAMGAFDALASGESDQVTFVYTAEDANEYSDTATVTVTINGVNDAPTVTSATAQTTAEETPITITLDMLNGETDVDDDDTSLTVVLTDGDNYSVNGATVTPDLDFFGDLTVPVAVKDDEDATSASVNMTITVTNVNDAPTLTAVTNQTTDEDTPITITLAMLDDENDVDGDNLTVVLTDGDNYSVAGAVVTPDANFNGTITVPVVVNDGTVDSAPAVDMTITVNAVNDRPTLTAVTNQTTAEDTPITITLDMLDDEADVEGTALAVVLTDGDDYSVNGAVVTPDLNYVGDITVPVAVSDGDLTSTPAVDMTITVTAVNDKPVVTTADITGPGNLVNGGAITVSNVNVDDVEEDAVDLSYVWYKGTGKDVIAGQTAATLPADAYGYVAGQNFPIYCEVTATETGTTELLASDVVTFDTYVGNEPPKIVENGTTALGTANVVEEGSSVTYTAEFDSTTSAPEDDGIASIIWYVKVGDADWTEAQDNEVTSAVGAGAASDSFTYTPDNNVQLHNDSVAVMVKVACTDETSSVREREWNLTVTDKNTNPELGTTSVSLTVDPQTGDDIEATVVKGATDADTEDNDQAKFTYVVTWYEGSTDSDAIYTEDLTDGETVSTLADTNTKKGMKYIAVVSVEDTQEAVAPTTASAEVTVVDTQVTTADTTLTIVDNATDTVDIDVVTDDPDEDDGVDTLVYALTGTVANGSAVINAGTGVISFTADWASLPEYDAGDASTYDTTTVDYTVSDGDDAASTGTLTVTVQGVNDAPVAYDVTGIYSEFYAAPEGDDDDDDVKQSEPFSLEATDVDTGSTIKFVLDSLPANGTLSLYAPARVGIATGVEYNFNTQFIFTPAADFIGATSFTFHAIDDKDAVSETKTVNIVVGTPLWFPYIAWTKADGYDWYKVTITDAEGKELISSRVKGSDTDGYDFEPSDYFNVASKGLLPNDTADATDFYTVEVVTVDIATGTEGQTNLLTNGKEEVVVEYGVAELPELISADQTMDGGNAVDNSYDLVFVAPNASGYTVKVYRDGNLYTTISDFYVPNTEGIMPLNQQTTVTVELLDEGTYTWDVTGYNPLGNGDTQTSTADEVDDIVIAAEDAGEQTAPTVAPTLQLPKNGSVVVADNGKTATVTLQWSRVSNATSYSVYVQAAGQTPLLAYKVIKGTSVDVVAPLGKYNWSVIAYNAEGYGAWSTNGTFTVVKDINTPVLDDVSVNGNDGLVLTFSTVVPDSVIIMQYVMATGKWVTWTADQIVNDNGTYKPANANFSDGDWVIISVDGGKTFDAYELQVNNDN